MAFILNDIFLKQILKLFHLLQCFSYNYLETIIRPTSKLHLTILIIEGEPGDVDLAGGHEDPGRDVGTETLVSDHHVCRIGPVKCFTRTEIIAFQFP